VIHVHIVGAAGYAAGEFVRLALAHPELEVGALESVSHVGSALADAFPALRDYDARFVGTGGVAAAVAPGDVVVLAGSRDLARERTPEFLRAGARVVDFSDAFRLAGHTEGAIYGWTERYAPALANATFVANPGCYPTASLLALAPLAALATRPSQLVVDAKSGTTGAGRSPRTELLFAETADDVRPYGLAGHRHQPEIAQQLAALEIDAPLVFTPHVVPLARGMLADCYAIYATPPDPRAVRAAYDDAYAGNRAVRVLAPDRAPSLRAVANTVNAELHVSVDGCVVRAISAIDNLGKGAAGQAMQSINLMHGWEKDHGLDGR